MAREQFEIIAPGNNLYLIYTERPEVPPKYVTSTPQTRFVLPNPEEIASFINTSEDVRAIILHSLNAVSSRVLNLLRRKLPILWLAWGYDVYNTNLSLQRHLYQPHTIRYLSKHLPCLPLWHCKLLLKSFLQRSGMYASKVYQNYLRAIQSITFCAPVFPSEAPVIRRHCGFKGQFLRFNYTWYGDVQNSAHGYHADPNNVLVGNSSTPTSNHIDAFEMLSRLDIAGRKIFVPLNYGDFDYRNYVIEVGEALFGENFFPIIDFLPADNYFALIKTCGTYILNHHRQQAGANIVTGLCNGSRVFLPERNPAYSYFRTLGATIFSLNRELTRELIEQPLSKIEADKNRTVVMSEYGREKVLGRTRKIVNILQTATLSIP